MTDYSHDRLLGVRTAQSSFKGISASLQLPTNIITAQSGTTNSDYVDFYLIYNSFVEAGISWTPTNGFHLFMNTYGGDGPAPYWYSYPLSHWTGINFGFGDTVTLRLEVNGAKSQLYCNGIQVYDMDNYGGNQPSTAAVGYTHGCADQYGYDQHNTASWSNVMFLYNGTWSPWTVGWGYNNIRTNESPYGIYTAHPLSAYLAKPNGPEPV